MSTPAYTHETIADLAETGRLDGKRVRFLATDCRLVPRGSIGIVSCAHYGKVTATFTNEAMAEGSAWREVTLETHVSNVELELVVE